MRFLIPFILFWGNPYNYKDPISTASYPIVEACVHTKYIGIMAYGGENWVYVNPEVYIPIKNAEITLSINLSKPDVYNPKLTITFNKTINKNKK